MWPRRKKRSRERVLKAYRQRRADAGDGQIGAEPIVGLESTVASERSRRGPARAGASRGSRESGARYIVGRAQRRRIGETIGIAAALTEGWRSVPSRPMAAGLALLLGISTLHLGLSGRYRVQGASVSGNQRIPADQVVEASGIAGRNIFTLDPEAIASRLEESEDYRDARVAAGLPSRVAIEVLESRVAFILDQGGERVGVDEGGRVVSSPPSDTSLPVLRDEESRLAPNGVSIDPDRLAAAAIFAPYFGELSYREEEGFIGRTAEGWPVYLGDEAAQAEARMARLDALLAELRDAGQEVELIDLRYDRRPYYRPQGD